MTGPEHYARAEALLDSVRNKNLDDVDDQGRTVESYDAEQDPQVTEMIAAAQVHATLATALGDDDLREAFAAGFARGEDEVSLQLKGVMGETLIEPTFDQWLAARRSS